MRHKWEIVAAKQAKQSHKRGRPVKSIHFPNIGDVKTVVKKKRLCWILAKTGSVLYLRIKYNLPRAING